MACGSLPRRTRGLCIGTANPFYGTQVWLLRNSPNKAQGE